MKREEGVIDHLRDAEYTVGKCNWYLSLYVLEK